MSINFIFHVKDDPTKFSTGAQYYYNGQTNDIEMITHKDQLEYIKQTHKDVYGRDIPVYSWSKKNPVYNRLFSIFKPNAEEEAINRAIREIEDKLDDYIRIYGDPKTFTPGFRIPIRNKPHRTGEIIGFGNIGQKFKLTRTMTACDIHWGRILFTKSVKKKTAGYDEVVPLIHMRYSDGRILEDLPADEVPVETEIKDGDVVLPNNPIASGDIVSPDDDSANIITKTANVGWIPIGDILGDVYGDWGSPI